MIVDFQTHYTPPELQKGDPTRMTVQLDENVNPNYLLNPLLTDVGAFMRMMDRTGIDAVEYAKEVVGLGAGEILLTSMDRDGTRAGFDIPLTRATSDAVTVPVIASGGVGTLDHLVEGIRDGGASAVLAASIFHFGDHTIGEAKRSMAAAGLPVRLDSVATV